MSEIRLGRHARGSESAEAGCSHEARDMTTYCLVACFLLLAVGCDLSQSRQQEDEGVAVVVQAERWVPPEITEAMLLAERWGKRTIPVPDDLERNDKLVDEIEKVLLRIRNQYPAMADVVMREIDRPNSMILELDRELFIRVSDIVDKAHDPVPLHTGHKAFDRLNAELGLRAVSSLPLNGSVVFHYDRFLDIEEEVRNYEYLEGVISVEPNALLTDGSDIDMLKRDGVWYVVFLEASGDCPSGCLHREYHFFIAGHSGVDSLDPELAQGVPEFARLVAYLNQR